MFPLEKIREWYKKGNYTPKYSGNPEDLRFFPELNRDFIKKHNEEVKKRRKEWAEIQENFTNDLRKDVTNYITEAYKVKKEQARLIEEQAWRQKRYMSDYFESIDELANFSVLLINLK